MVGGIAERADFGFEAMDDLQLAIERLLAETGSEGRVTMAFDLLPGRIRVRVGPLMEEGLARALQVPGDAPGRLTLSRTSKRWWIRSGSRTPPATRSSCGWRRSWVSRGEAGAQRRTSAGPGPGPRAAAPLPRGGRRGRARTAGGAPPAAGAVTGPALRRAGRAARGTSSRWARRSACLKAIDRFEPRARACRWPRTPHPTWWGRSSATSATRAGRSGVPRALQELERAGRRDHRPPDLQARALAQRRGDRRRVETTPEEGARGAGGRARPTTALSLSGSGGDEGEADPMDSIGGGGRSASQKRSEDRVARGPGAGEAWLRTRARDPAHAPFEEGLPQTQIAARAGLPPDARVAPDQEVAGRDARRTEVKARLLLLAVAVLSGCSPGGEAIPATPVRVGRCRSRSRPRPTAWIRPWPCLPPRCRRCGSCTRRCSPTPARRGTGARL